MRRRQRSALGLAVGLVLLLASLPAFAAGKAPASPVDVNSATVDTLKQVPGIGEATAKKIVAGRPYKSLDELTTKAGLPAKTVEKLKPMLSVGAAPAAPAPPAAKVPAAKAPAPPAPAVPSAKAPAAPAAQASASTASKHAAAAPKLAPGQKVNINSAPKEMLDALPGIGPVKAQAIIDGRPYSKIEDVMKVKGIKEGEFSKIKDLITVQ